MQLVKVILHIVSFYFTYLFTTREVPKLSNLSFTHPTLYVTANVLSRTKIL